MDIAVLYTRLKNLLVRPESTWHKIKTEKIVRFELIKFYAFPLILIICIFSFIGGYIFDSFKDSIIISFILFIANFVSLYITAYLFYKMTINMGILTTIDEIFKLIIYSLSAFFLASALAEIHTSISFLRLFGAYSIVLLWTGIRVMLNVSEDRRIFYTIFIVFIFLTLYYSIKIVLIKLFL